MDGSKKGWMDLRKKKADLTRRADVRNNGGTKKK